MKRLTSFSSCGILFNHETYFRAVSGHPIQAEFENRKASKFDHNKAAFKLDGKHQNVACAKCHKEKIVEEKKYVLYKIKDFKCENCHL